MVKFNGVLRQMTFKDFLEKTKQFLGIGYRVAKDEIKEVITLEPTKEDFEQGEKLATMAAAVMAGCGVAIPAIGITAMEKTFAYGIRNLKDGVVDNDKLIIVRVINELKQL